MSVYTSDVGLLLYVSHQCYQIWRRHLALILRCVQVNSITVMLHRLSLLQTLQWTGWVRYSSESWLPDVDWCFQSCLLEFCCSAVRFWLCWVAGLSALADTALVGMVASSYLSSTGQRLLFYGTSGSTHCQFNFIKKNLPMCDVRRLKFRFTHSYQLQLYKERFFSVVESAWTANLTSGTFTFWCVRTIFTSGHEVTSSGM